MGKFLIIINISLTIVAALLTNNLVNPTIPVDTNSTSSLPISENSERVGIVDETNDQIPKLGRQESDILWEKNLFHPDRSFEESILDDLDIKEPEQVNEHFELMSIAQVANKSCASIRVIKGANRQQKRRKNTRTSNRRKNTRRGPSKAAKDKNQKVYMLGDSVGETGFKLNEISIDYIVIKKGDQELTLRLDKSDESSEKRREVAKKEVDKKSKKDLAARKRIETAKSKEKKPPNKIADTDAAKKSIPPPPPPPPPAFNRGTQQPTTNQNSTSTNAGSQERRKSQYPRPTRR